MPSITLRTNLTACCLFCLLVFGIGASLGGFRAAAWKDSVGYLALILSPIVIWSAGAWMLKGHLEMSIMWLVASIVLMLVGLLGVYADAEAWRKERLTGQETMHLAAFFAMLLQWFLAVPLLAAAGAIRLFTDSDPVIPPACSKTDSLTITGASDAEGPDPARPRRKHPGLSATVSLPRHRDVWGHRAEEIGEIGHVLQETEVQSRPS